MSTKSKWAAIIVGVLMFVAMFVWRTGVQADATTGELCAKPSEFSQLEVPMPAKEARQILDGPGKRMPGHPHVRVYDICGHPNAVDRELYVWYSKGRLTAATWMVSWITGPPPGYVNPADQPLPPDVSYCTDPNGVVVDCNFRAAG